MSLTKTSLLHTGKLVEIIRLERGNIICIYEDPITGGYITHNNLFGFVPYNKRYTGKMYVEPKHIVNFLDVCKEQVVEQLWFDEYAHNKKKAFTDMSNGADRIPHSMYVKVCRVYGITDVLDNACMLNIEVIGDNELDTSNDADDDVLFNNLVYDNIKTKITADDLKEIRFRKQGTNPDTYDTREELVEYIVMLQNIRYEIRTN